ncbi:hypothetical protein PENTCL1PPCAC_30, partial [Pristionchus entomophagus]
MHPASSLSSATTLSSLLPHMTAWSMPDMAHHLFVKTEDLQASLLMESHSTTTQSSPNSSPSQSPRPLKRGRPQQEIEDDAADAGSQRRKHRRLYAREYRAQMRKKVDEVETLRQAVDLLQRERALSEARRLDTDVKVAQLERALSESSQREAALSSLLTQFILNSMPQPAIPVSSGMPVSL